MLSQEYVKECVCYCYESGILTWRHRPYYHFSHCGDYCERTCNTWNTKFSGLVCGSIRSEKRNGAGTKYIEVGLTISGNRKSFFAHKLIWLYVTGEYDGIIDHIDGDGLNNKWENLRMSTSLENSMNARMSKNNTSGFNGVSWHKRDKKWNANIRINGSLIYGGAFTNIEDAIKCRKQLNIDHGFHELHGQIKKGDYNDQR